MRPGANHIDRQTRLLPRDYLSPPEGFGLDPAARIVLPESGDVVSRNLAQLQHQLVLAWRRNQRRPSSGALREIYGFSRQTWSRSTRGERWMGGTVGAALFHAVTQARQQR